MARHDNPFALLGDDDDGTDLMALVARAEAMASSEPEPSKSMPTIADDFDSKPAEYARGRGSGVRGRGPGRGGYSREFVGDLDGRGPGRGWGRGRGRGRGFFGGRAFGNENRFLNGIDENYGEGGGHLEDGLEIKEKNINFGENLFVKMSYGREDRANRVSEGRDIRSFAGGENYGYRGGEGRRHGAGNYGYRGVGGRRYGGGRGRMQYGIVGGENGSELKLADDNRKEQAADNVTSGNGGTGSNDHPEASEASSTAQSVEKSTEENVARTNSTRLNEKASEGKVSGEKVQEEEDNKMTLDEYEKLLHEKRKPLEALKTEERKVIIDKQFDGMQLVDKKQEDDLFIKLKFEKDKLKNKDFLEKEGKARKSVSINEFLKPAEGEIFHYRGTRGRGRGHGEGNEYRGGFVSGRDISVPAVSIEDPSQFPILGGAVMT